MASSGPPAGSPAEEPLLEFREVMRRLRAECGWKREQTHRSLSRYLVEELHETLEALDTWEQAVDPRDPEAAEHLCEELGDLLLQVYFHAVIAEETGAFTLDDVARGIVAKMRRRNPHVFGPDGEHVAPGGDAPLQDPAGINEVWQEIKAAEKARSSVIEGLPASLPALLYADKVLDRLARERGTPAVEQPSRDPDLGDRLLALVAEAHDAGIDPEQALRDAVRRLL